MKKVLLAVSLCCPLLAVWLSPLAMRALLPVVQAAHPTPGAYDTYLNFTGSVEFSGTEELSLPLPVLPGSIRVSLGDQVEQGDILFTVDKPGTYEALQNGGFSTLELPSLLASYEPVLDAIGALGSSMSIESVVAAYQDIPSAVPAPVSGMVTVLDVSPGALTNPSHTLAAVSPVQSLQVKISVSEDKISQLQVGQPVLITCAAIDGKTYHGTVESISPLARKSYSLSSQSTVVDVFLHVDDPDGQLRPGFTAKAKIHVRRDGGAFFLPYSALILDASGQETVYLWQQGRAVSRPVECLSHMENGYVALSGVSESDLVITNPASVPASGALVQLE